MDLSIRRDRNDMWCYVESFKKYQTIETGNIRVILSVSPEGKFAKPYVFRDGAFLPADVIEKEMGIEKYIKAKKPFYCNIADGFVVELKAGLNFVTGEYIPEKSSYTIYQLANSELSSDTSGTIRLKRVLDIPDELKNLMEKLSLQVVESRGDRAVFLKGRM